MGACVCYPGRSWFELEFEVKKKRMEWNGMEWCECSFVGGVLCYARDPVLDVMAFL